MSEKNQIRPFSLKDAPAFIEQLLPAQKLSVEVYKERKAGPGQTLTVLGGYWKGRKPLIMNKACVLGSLLPVTADLKRDLEIFELLMAMDDKALAIRLGHVKPAQIVERVPLLYFDEFFEVEPETTLPEVTPFRIADFPTEDGKIPRITWRDSISEATRLDIEVQALPQTSYRELVEKANRPELCDQEELYNHVWDDVNDHLGTDAYSIPELVEQLGIMRFGHKPRVADTFSGSGQIPYEAARLGCDVYASDLSPISCMLTWGALTIVGATKESNDQLRQEETALAKTVQDEIDRLGIDTDGKGWKAKSYLYCLETSCPQTGWMVPLLPSFVVSLGRSTIVELKPDSINKRYIIDIRSGVTPEELQKAFIGTIRSEGRGQDPYLVHTVDGVEYRNKISTIRGDYRTEEGTTANRLRLWDKSDFKPRPEDIFQERLYAVHWMRNIPGRREEYKICAVTKGDLSREQIVEEYIKKHIVNWQEKGWIPDMRIEAGSKTDEPIRTRGWTHWHQLFPPRHLLLLALIRQNVTDGRTALMLSRVLDYTSKLCHWTTSRAGSSNEGGGKRTGGASDNPSNVFYNQALNTFLNYGCRSSSQVLELFTKRVNIFPVTGNSKVVNQCAQEIDEINDIYITDPPYGDAVKYEEILEFFIAWLRKNPPKEFADWTWDSRRTLAIKGEDEDFRKGMVAAYKKMAKKMPDNGIQIIMFTHQSGSIWSDMANIVWASGLQVTAAWYVVTETDSAIREGSYVKGTILLVLRKRHGLIKTSRGDLAWEIQEGVEEQVNTLTGLNQDARELYRDENLFSDADLQMAGYAAALRVLTRYSIIDGKEMETEAVRPRVKGQTTFVDDLIDFAVGVANQCLVPRGIEKAHWNNLQPAERFYLKMLDLEGQGEKKLANYQNFAKAFKVRNFKPLMASEKTNSSRLRSSEDFGRAEMSGESEFANTTLRGVLYGIWELQNEVDSDKVISHLVENIPDFYRKREMIIEVADYLSKKLEHIRSEEASSARVLRDLVRNQKMG